MPDKGETVLTGIVFDAMDPARLEEFWFEAVQGRTHGLYLRFDATTRPKVGKNRLHLDLAGGEDWEAEVDRLIALGATRTDIGRREVDWDVLADPEGNEFWVVRPNHPGVWCSSGLATICLDVAPEHRFDQSPGSGWALVGVRGVDVVHCGAVGDSEHAHEVDRVAGAAGFVEDAAAA